MKIVEILSALAFRPLFDGPDGSPGPDFWARHWEEDRERIAAGFGRALDHAGKAVEVVVAGPVWWDRCKMLLEPGEDTAVGERVQVFFDSAASAIPSGTGEEHRRQGLHELDAARTANLLAGNPLQTAPFVAWDSARQQLVDWSVANDGEAADRIAAELRSAGFPFLAEIVAHRPLEGTPFLIESVRYFLRREVETDGVVARHLAAAGLTLPSLAPAVRFDALADVLTHHPRRLDVLLAASRAGAEPRGYPLDLAREARGHGEGIQQLAQAVAELLHEHHLAGRELRLSDSLSLRRESDRHRVRDLLARFHALDAEPQRRLPALVNGLAMLQAAAGDFEAAHRDFQVAAGLVATPHALAILHFNASRVALEQRDWAEALTLWERAVALWPERFSPFPIAKYEAERILAVGASGLTFLCRHRATEGRVVIKSLGVERLRRDPAEVFREVHVLESLNHPGFVRLRDCDFADAAQTAPFLVTDYFEGQSLAEQVQQHGPVKPDDLLAVARLLAEALLAAHEHGILHRDVKPANVLLRHDEAGWRVKLIDFGLVLKPMVLHGQLTHTSLAARSAVGAGAAGSIPYAAPEEIGWIEGVPVAAYSDVYSFGKTCYFALLGTPEPDDEEKETLPPAWRKLLGACTARSVARRLPNFKTVLERLAKIKPATPDGAVKPPTEPTPSPGLSRADAEKLMGYVNRGMAARQHGDYARAIAAFSQALQIDPRLTAGYIKRGNVYSDQGDLDKAIADYTTALRLEPKNALAYLNRGLAHAKKGEFDQVLADCGAALELDPKLASAHFIRGTAYSNRGERHRAIAEFNLALRLDPKNPLAHNDRGLAYAEQGEYDRAIADYTAALRLEPRLTLAYVNRGIAFQKKGDLQRSVAEFTKALRLEPRNVPALFQRGLALVAREAFDHAVADFDRVLKLDPRHPDAAARREEALRARGKATTGPDGRPSAARRTGGSHPGVKVARPEAERPAAPPPTSQEEERRQVRGAAYFARGRTFFEQGEYNQAIEQFTKALQMDPKDAMSYYNRGLAYVAKTEYQEAIADYTSALHQNPRNAMAYYHRGIAHRLLGEHDRAIADYTRALRLDPRLAVAYRNRGQAYAAKGETDRARADLEQANRLDPSLAKR